MPLHGVSVSDTIGPHGSSGAGSGCIHSDCRGATRPPGCWYDLAFSSASTVALLRGAVFHRQVSMSRSRRSVIEVSLVPDSKASSSATRSAFARYRAPRRRTVFRPDNRDTVPPIRRVVLAHDPQRDDGGVQNQPLHEQNSIRLEVRYTFRSNLLVRGMPIQRIVGMVALRRPPRTPRGGGGPQKEGGQYDRWYPGGVQSLAESGGNRAPHRRHGATYRAEDERRWMQRGKRVSAASPQVKGAFLGLAVCSRPCQRQISRGRV